MQLSNVCSFERVSMCGVYWEEWYERLVMGERRGGLCSWWLKCCFRSQGGLNARDERCGSS